MKIFKNNFCLTKCNSIKNLTIYKNVTDFG